jgi:hypothetical protein
LESPVGDNEDATVRQPTDLTTATTRFRAMITYGQFAWYEPLLIAWMMMMMEDEVVVVIE